MLNTKKNMAKNNKPRINIILPVTLFVVILFTGIFMFRPSKAQAATYNYGEALQKAIYFYECQVSGPKPSSNRVEWRGDSCMNDPVSGGWMDAGDHMKFGLPMAYSASMLGWAAYEYRNAFISAGQMGYLENNLKYVLDYFVKCDLGTSLVYQIGDATAPSWWGPVECLEKKIPARPAYTCKASCVTGQTAAALAIGSIVLNNSTYLTHAKSLFNLADSTKSDADYTAAAGFYQSWSGYWDELIWAAVWLYIATNDSTYLTKAESYVVNLNKQGQSTDIEYQYGNNWDDVHYSALLMLAKITGRQQYHDFIKMHLDWWTVGYNGSRVTYTPGGLAWLEQWGPLRYAANTALNAFIYSDLITDATLKSRYQSFAEKQINYILGDNPRNGSYEVGFGSLAPMHPIHRTAHGSWCDSKLIPANHRHILYGALVGGPGSSDGYVDSMGAYNTNEVACDYNAGFVGALAKMYLLNGGTPLSGFPAPETRDDEFYIEALASSNSSSSTIQINALNHSAWPARMIRNLSYNYYVDLSEVFAAGYSVSDVKVENLYQEIPVTISPLTLLGGNVYYVKVAFADGTDVWPGGNIEHSREVQIRFSAPVWNAANDWSASGLTGVSAKTSYITMYDGTMLIWGYAPPITVTPSPTPTRVTVTPTVTAPPVTPTPTTGVGGYVVSYLIQSDWGTGATVSVTITNNTNTAVHGWTLSWTFSGNQTITNMWNGTHTQSGASVAVKGADYFSTIPPNGGSVNFGFTMNYSGINAKPTSFILGVPCQAQ